MVYRLRPLALKFDFEDRSYKLGETIHLTLELTPNADVQVRGGRVDLVCEERYVQTGVSFIPDTYSPGGGIGGISGSTGHVAKERRERFVHSSVPFVAAAELKARTNGGYTARLQIQAAPPPHAEKAKALVRDASSSWSFHWTLVATVDVARGRDPKTQRKIKVTL